MAKDPIQSDILDRLDGLSIAELDVVDGVTPGTATASKAVILDSSSKIDVLDITAPKIGGVSISATAAELNLLDNQWASVTMVVGSESADKINVTLQFKDAAGNDMAVPVCARWYFSDDSAGLNPTTTAHDGAVVIGTDGAIIEITAKLNGYIISEADGDADIDITDAGAFTVFLVIVLPTGALSISATITHAA